MTLEGRNEIGQLRRPRVLSQVERRMIGDACEQAINSGKQECRIFWVGDRNEHIYVAPLSIGEKTRIG